MTTRTVAEIVEKCIAVIEALTPDVGEPQSRKFRLNREASRVLRAWVPVAGATGMLRLFDIWDEGRQDIGTNAIAAVQVTHAIRITVCYPAEPKLYGLAQRHELSAMVSSDAQQIKDALRAPTAMAGSGHVCNLITDIPSLDRSSERVWFQDLVVNAVFFTGQRG